MKNISGFYGGGVSTNDPNFVKFALQEISNYNETCKKIDKNNLYIEEFEGLDFNSGLREPVEPDFMESYNTLKQDIAMLVREIASFEKDL